jgi:YwiC-like protein
VNVISKLNSGPAELGREGAGALIVPHEHGAWGLLLVPFFTGAVTGNPSVHQLWPRMEFNIAALCLLWRRTAVEGLLGWGPIVVRAPQERQSTVLASVVLSSSRWFA